MKIKQVVRFDKGDELPSLVLGEDGNLYRLNASFYPPKYQEITLDIPHKKKYTSIAIWPENSGVSDMYGQPVSRDDHETHKMAQAVCRTLETEGLGGLRKVFPIYTFVM